MKAKQDVSHQVFFFVKDVEGCRDDYYNIIRSNQGNCKIFRLHIGWMEKNYLKWSQLVRTVLKGKGKISHLMGTRLKLGDPHFEVWDEEDSIILAWLWNSMTPEISDTCMFLATAKDI